MQTGTLVPQIIVLSWIALCLRMATWGEDAQLSLERDVAKRCEAWARDWEEQTIRWSSYMDPVERCRTPGQSMYDHAQSISRLGPGVAPLLIRRMEEAWNTGEPLLSVLHVSIEDALKTKLEIIHETTKSGRGIAYFRDFPDFVEPEPCATAKLWLRLWHNRVVVEAFFKQEYTNWRTLRKLERFPRDDLPQARWDNMVRLGALALPMWVQKLQEDKDPAIVEAISQLTDGEIGPTATVDEVVAWWRAPDNRWRLGK